MFNTVTTHVFRQEKPVFDPIGKIVVSELGIFLFEAPRLLLIYISRTSTTIGIEAAGEPWNIIRLL
jgi:hypothetical protein